MLKCSYYNLLFLTVLLLGIVNKIVGNIFFVCFVFLFNLMEH